jgi:CRP/FNR family cyclic AMP-dependent transcriptional regulator
MSLLHDVLSTAPLFSSFIERDLVALASAMQERTLKEGEALFRQGQAGDSMVLVTGGQLAISSEDEEGHSVELARMAIGDIVGEMSALDPAPRSANVKALVNSTVCWLDRTMLEALFSNAPTVYSSLLNGIGRTVTSRLERTNKHIREEAFGHVNVVEPPTHVPEEAPGELVTRTIDPSQLKPLSGFTRSERADLLRAASVVSFRAGETLCSEGKPGHTCFILGGGEVEVIRHSGAQEHRLTTLGPGSVVGQLALLHNTPRSATVRAVDDVWVVAIGRGVFNRLLNAQDGLALKLQEQAIVAGIRQLRIASRMLLELRAVQEDTLSDYPAITPGMLTPQPSKAARHETQQLLDELKVPSPKPQRWGGAPPKPAATPTPQAKGADPLSANRDRRSHQAWQAVDTGQHAAARKKRSGARVKSPTRQMAMYVTTALSEWGLSLSDLDDVQISVPSGQITAAELKARKG